MEIKNNNVKVTYSKKYNGNYEGAKFEGYAINWTLNDRPAFSTNDKMAYTKPYKSPKKWADTMDKIVASFDENTTFNDICKIVGYSNYTEFYTDN